MTSTIESATATMSAVQTTPGVYQYTITLTNTGNTTIGTFWFSWVPGQNYMSQIPSAIGDPSNWQNIVTSNPFSGGTGYAIQWSAKSSANYFTPTQSSSAFTFTSTETPTEMAASSPFVANTPTTTSFVYQDGPLVGLGDEFTVAVVPACFREGTRIRTPRGDIAIETLLPGDHVVTTSGEVRPIIWTGRHHVLCDRDDHPARLWPIRVLKGALGPGTPAEDLYLSPDHALFLDEVLVPVKYLVNQTTFAPFPVDAVTWCHLELESHDVILAEGAPAETYLDTGDRAKFESVGVGLFGGAATPGYARTVREARSPLRLVVTGPELAMIRRRLTDRAGTLMRFSLAEQAA